MKRPAPGDWIAHDALNVYGELVQREGMVISVLSEQFTYETEDGDHRFAFFSDTWKQAGEAPWLK